MEDQEWSVIQCVGAKGELIWSVVHRQKPMFVAVVSDRSLDQLEVIPSGAIHWAKQASSTHDQSLLREALEMIRSCRDGKQPSLGRPLSELRLSRPGRSRRAEGRRSTEAS